MDDLIKTDDEKGASIHNDFALLGNKDEYAKYFNHLALVFKLMLSAFSRKEENDSTEGGVVREFMGKLLFTIEALRLKSLYDPGHSLKIDLTESGFPNSIEITYLLNDLMTRDQALAQLPPRSILKQQMLDHIMSHKIPPPADLQWLVGKRDYLKMIDAEKLFLAFTPGKLELQSENDGSRSYRYTWGCYDLATNRPYIHILIFEQDKKEDPLEVGKTAYHQFMQTVTSEGSRVPDIGILALAIDDRVESIHPKILKRIAIGPVYSRFLLESSPLGDDERQKNVAPFLEKYGERDDDFVVFFRHETVFSERQVTVSRSFLRTPRVREVFYIPQMDPECVASKASLIHRYMLMPHTMAQHLDEYAGIFDRYKKLTFDYEGGVHGG